MLSIAGVLNSSRPPVSRVPSLDVMQLKAVDINSLESTVLRQFFPG